MKKVFTIFILIMLLGKIPLAEWNKCTLEQKRDFMRATASEYCSKEECNKAVVSVITNNDGFVYFYGECAEEKQKQFEL